MPSGRRKAENAMITDDNQLPVPIVPAQDIGPWQNALGSLLSNRGLYEKQSTEARGAALLMASNDSTLELERIADIPTGRLSGIVNHHIPKYLRSKNH